MNRKKHIALIYFFAVLQIFVGTAFNCIAQNSSGKLKISFTHTVNAHPLSMNDSTYINSNNESYKISKLKYYLFNFKLNDIPLYSQQGKYILVNAEKKDNVIEFEKINNGTYSSISFDLGVDSIDNCSGAQNGSLDPINDMFWTWNSGYVFFKLEGSSPNSTADLNRIEYHLGGYKGEYALKTTIHLNFVDNNGNQSAIIIDSKKETEIVTEMNVDEFWQEGKINIKEQPICVSPGILAKKLGNCFSTLFSIKSILNH